jgi:hypothetical protein
MASINEEVAALLREYAALRDALRALPADATQDDIYAVLAGHVATGATGAELRRSPPARQRP